MKESLNLKLETMAKKEHVRIWNLCNCCHAVMLGTMAHYTPIWAWFPIEKIMKIIEVPAPLMNAGQLSCSIPRLLYKVSDGALCQKTLPYGLGSQLMKMDNYTAGNSCQVSHPHTKTIGLHGICRASRLP
jgi:hypothetical protein